MNGILESKVELTFAKSPGLGNISSGREKVNLLERKGGRELNDDQNYCKNSLILNKEHQTFICHQTTNCTHCAERDNKGSAYTF